MVRDDHEASLEPEIGAQIRLKAGCNDLAGSELAV
jgi:hypothetical protein